MKKSRCLWEEGECCFLLSQASQRRILINHQTNSVQGSLRFGITMKAVLFGRAVGIEPTGIRREINQPLPAPHLPVLSRQKDAREAFEMAKQPGCAFWSRLPPGGRSTALSKDVSSQQCLPCPAQADRLRQPHGPSAAAAAPAGR